MCVCGQGGGGGGNCVWLTYVDFCTKLNLSHDDYVVLITDTPAGHVNDTATGTLSAATRDCITNHQTKSHRQLTCPWWASSLWPILHGVPVTNIKGMFVPNDALPEIPLGWL